MPISLFGGLAAMTRLILIDDSEEILVLVRKALGDQYAITWSSTVADGLKQLESHIFDAILLDVLLPDGDGFQICARLQKSDRLKAIPILFLTGKTGVSNRVTGLSLGADDYIEKPFDFLELRTRVENRVNKMRLKSETDSVLSRGPLQINFANQTVRLVFDGGVVEPILTPLEFKLLHYLARQDGRTLSRDQLMTGVWGENIVVADRTIDKHISSLRQKLGTCADFVETVPGFGYRFSYSNTREVKAA
jgi:DNA-binding response OmpR family regulator